MSIALGDVARRTVTASANNSAPKKASYLIGKGTSFHRLIDVVCEYKRYYNSTSVTKDLVAAGLSMDAQSLLSEGLRWANVSVLDTGARAGSYVINSSAIMVEIETRLRIHEFNNTLLTSEPKPDARVVGIPLFTYFLKHPTEIITALDIFESGLDNPAELFRNSSSLLIRLPWNYARTLRENTSSLGSVCPTTSLVPRWLSSDADMNFVEAVPKSSSMSNHAARFVARLSKR
jgi:hypothetical protein